MHIINYRSEEIIKINLNYMYVLKNTCVIGGLASAISEVKCEESIFVKQINLELTINIQKVAT